MAREFTSARACSSEPAHFARAAGQVYVLHSSVALGALALANSCKITRQRCSIAVVRNSLIIQFVEGARILTLAATIILVIAACPFIYYLLSLYSAVRYFSTAKKENAPNEDFFPPISCLKPIKGLDD